MQDIINGRCGWCGTDELYVKYHDEEWGKTVGEKIEKQSHQARIILPHQSPTNPKFRIKK